MQALKKFGITLAIAAGVGGGAVFAAPTAGATGVTGVTGDLAQSSGCFYNYQWYDVCPTFNVGGHDDDRNEAQERSRDRRRDRERDRDRDHHEDHGGHH